MFILKASRSLAACSREALRTNVRMIKQTTIIFIAMILLLAASPLSASTIYVAQSAGTFSGGTACNGQTAESVSTFNGAGTAAGNTVYLCGVITSQITVVLTGSSGSPISRTSIEVYALIVS